MTEQLQLRRGTASQVVAFTGAQGELVVDTTNNRAVVNDGATAGGWPAAKLAEVITNSRTAVADAAYTAQAADRLVAYASLSAARVVTLCAAAAYPTGTRLTIVDESGACSAANTITVQRAGSDTIGGATSAVVSSAYGYLGVESDGVGKWTIVDQAMSNLGAVGVGTAADPNNPLSVYGASALFNGASFSFTINKAAAADTASIIFEDGFSGRAQMGINGSDNFSFKVSPNGSTWTTAIALDATTGVATLANQRTAVSDAAYSALVTDRLIAYTALTAARMVTLPAASAYPPGQQLVIIDESGACSTSKTISAAPNGTDKINGVAASVALSVAYGHLELESNGSNAWVIVGSSSGQTLASPTISGTLTGPDGGTWGSGGINGSAIGQATAETGAFTTLSATGKISGAAATSSAASINEPQGTAPGAPNNGDGWNTVGGRYRYLNGMTRGVVAAIGQSHIPFVIPSSGAMGANGALSGVTAVATAYPNAYVYLPAGAIYSGSAAGWYYAVFSSTTAATVYNNTYTSGTPQIPASPTAFSTTGPGAYTQTTGSAASEITAYSLTIPGNTVGPNGAIRAFILRTNNNSANNKGLTSFYSSFSLGEITETVDINTAQVAGFSNRGVTNIQAPSTNYSNIFGGSTTAIAFGAIDTTQNQSFTIGMFIVNAGDTITLESVVVEHIPGVP
jgi:hypothetical protein